jgi:hypothetical protein
VSGEAATVEAGRKAWHRLRGSASFNDWVTVSKALAVGRSECMASAKTNRPVGTTYNRCMGEWLRNNGFDGIGAQERYRAGLVLENLTSIEKWRAELDETQRRRLNHPAAIWHAWRKAAGADSRQARHTINRREAPPGDLFDAILEGIEQAWKSQDKMVLARAIWVCVKCHLNPPKPKQRAPAENRVAA